MLVVNTLLFFLFFWSNQEKQEFVPVFAQPMFTAKKIANLDKALTNVVRLDEKAGWIRVRVEGWVRATDLKGALTRREALAPVEAVSLEVNRVSLDVIRELRDIAKKPEKAIARGLLSDQRRRLEYLEGAFYVDVRFRNLTSKKVVGLRDSITFYDRLNNESSAVMYDHSESIPPNGEAVISHFFPLYDYKIILVEDHEYYEQSTEWFRWVESRYNSPHRIMVDVKAARVIFEDGSIWTADS